MRASAEIGHAEPQSDRRFSLRETAHILEVPEARLRALARAGFLAPHPGPLGPISFGFQDLLLLRTTKALLESGVSMRRIRRIWASLRKQLANNLPLTSIAIRTDGEEVVASDGSAQWRADTGQFLLNFDASEIAERAADTEGPAHPLAGAAPRLTLTRADEAAAPASPADLFAMPDAADVISLHGTEDHDYTALEWYEWGCDLEASDPGQAREAYERSLEMDPRIADVHVNLGRMLHVAGERGRAEPHYREAVRLAPDDPTPHFNLGVLLEESGRRDDAVHAYRQAILRDPDFADAHCNLGLLLESLARRQEAMRHLMAARKLSGATE